MGKAGRFACVFVPFALTTASLICILIVGLAGVTNKGLYMFEAETKNLSISNTDLINLATADLKDFTSAADGAISDATVNITAADLGLADYYTVALWNYCYTTGSTTTCTKAAFDWASNATNTTELNTLASQTGVKVTVPKAIETALKTFSLIAKWTEIVYIIAAIATACALLVGLFAICSKIGSCCTFLINGIATVAIIAASVLSTVMSSTVVATLEAASKPFGVKASFNTSFLVITWLAAAFSLAAGLFWAFSICCCSAGSSERRDKRRSKAGDSEKPYGTYQRVDDPFAPHTYSNQQSGVYNPSYGVPMNNMKPTKAGAYEPYSHGAV